MAGVSPERKKILLVDDDELHLDLAGMVLSDEYDIYKAKSGKEALLHIYKGLVPDLIMLDLLMPNMDGWDIFNRIKLITLLYDIPIVFLTSVTEVEEQKRAFEKGAADYIMKPINNDDLKNRIKKAIKKL